MEKKLFSDLFDIVTIYMPVEQLLFNQIVAVVMTLVITWIYKITYSGVIYSKNFNVTLLLVSIVTTTVMMVIKSSLALSIGMLGALTIIRFRSAIKDTKDIGFLFWGMSVGLSAGTGYHSIAIAGTLFIAVIVIVYHKLLGEQFSYLLIIKGSHIPEDQLASVFTSFSHKYKLKMKNADDSGSEMIYEIQIKKKEEHALIDKLNAIKEVKSVNMVSNKGELLD
jgi:uncharacterized membrane protein YhiD involved in acid resistance